MSKPAAGGALSSHMTKLPVSHVVDNAPILEVDRQIKRLLGQADPEDCDGDSPDKKDWELHIPTYIIS
ncbi:hypothetical protein PMAA_077180 [Talaromyces marneffei ATCC 18224]|uniref:Uncharacterized protein n=1 Tax=Talaromyces marneffei (strain ATCC 18224 / CBS 334.59 / QM 7333) TaxID=441960 RepID=B6QCX4_TALMQ|nr:hypothetical protein PMAA_077180 [Talaromyces marneffei ATCC 18224]